MDDHIVVYTTQRPGWVTLALFQGIAVPVLYWAVAIGGGLSYPAYSHISQAVSELTAAGAPNKKLLDFVLLLMELLTVAFGLGFLWCVRSVNLRLQSSAALLTFVGLAGVLFFWFPMDPVGGELTFEGRVHLIIVSLSAVAAILAVFLSSLGWSSLERRMSRMSYIAVAVMLASGLMSVFVGAQGLPGIGLLQRINIGAFSVWQIATALHLLRVHGRWCDY